MPVILGSIQPKDVTHIALVIIKYINIKMRKTLFSLLIVSVVMLAGCSGLSKMKSNSKKIRYQANPDPVETRDDKVVVNFTASVPQKYFKKGVALFIQPVFTWEGGSTQLAPITVKGEGERTRCLHHQLQHRRTLHL